MQPSPELWLERTIMVSSDECMKAHHSRWPPAVAFLVLAGVWIWIGRLGRTGRIHTLLQTNAKKHSSKLLYRGGFSW
jgi:hypothetical protein